MTITVPKGKAWHESPQALLIDALRRALGSKNPVDAISTTHRNGEREIIAWIGNRDPQDYTLPKSVHDWIFRHMSRSPDSGVVPSITFEMNI